MVSATNTESVLIGLKGLVSNLNKKKSIYIWAGSPAAFKGTFPKRSQRVCPIESALCLDKLVDSFTVGWHMSRLLSNPKHPQPRPQGPAVLLNSHFIAHSCRPMSSRDLTNCFTRALGQVGSFSQAAETSGYCQLKLKLNNVFQRIR